MKKERIVSGLVFVAGTIFNFFILGNMALVQYFIGFLLGAIACGICWEDER